MLIGPNAAIVMDRRVRSTYMANVYDFYKPDLSSEYPYVDGPLSNKCYLQALDKCYNLYFDKVNLIHANCSGANEENHKTVTLDSFDGILFHAPYCKLVQKSVARMYLLNSLRLHAQNPTLLPIQLEKYKYACLSLIYLFIYLTSDHSFFRNIKLEDSYNDRDLEKLLLTLSSDIFLKKTDPSLMLAREIGNMYTASLYACLISYLLR